ncbi:MAG TPA: hypothetical protein VF334_15290, partial [Polyangia bacterium]
MLAVHGDARATTASSSPECGGSVSSTTLDPTSTSTSFAAGSLIIPMDSCNNPDQAGNTGPLNNSGTCSAGPSYTCFANYTTGDDRLPFGLLYLLAENNIPVSVILKNDKAGLTNEDFHVTPPSGSSTTVPTVSKLTASSTGYTVNSSGMKSTLANQTVYYHGMPFVVEASFVPQALQVITTFNNNNSNLFSSVNLHIANYPFTAPVLAVLASRPKPVLIDGSPLDTFFSESGITSVAAANTTYLNISGSGSSWQFTWPLTLSAAPAGCSATGVCTSPVDSNGSRIVDVIWAQNALGNINNWSTIGSYFASGGTALAVDAAMSWESGSGGTLGGGITKPNGGGTEAGPYCAGVAVKESSGPLSQPGPTAQYPASNRFFQIDDLDLTILGNGGGSAVGADGASSWYFTSTPATYTQGLSNGDDYGVIAGHPMVSGTQTNGNLVYLASLHSWSGHSQVKDGGLHIMYNTLVTGGGNASSCTAAELTRSSSVAHLLSKSDGTVIGYAEYLGSFDWEIPANGAALGNILYQANPADYPYMTGHFREYKPAGTYTATTSTTNTPTCSSTDQTSPCNWDAATSLKKFSQRNIFVGTGTYPSYTLTAAASVPSSDSGYNMLQYIKGKLDTTSSTGATIGVLGGIDWSTAAVIESHPVGSFTSRPTIAYVG